MIEGVRRTLRGLGELLVTAGIVLLLFVVYELEVTSVYTAREQTRLGQDLQHAWTAAAPQRGTGAVAAAVDPVPPLGDALARLYLPRLGRGYHKVVVQGVERSDLEEGPGHLPGSALPGQLGNVVISGHRTTYGAPFNRLDELQVGDAVVVETRTTWYTYRVTGLSVVAPTAVEVTFPVPGDAGATPTQRLLTLTTCNPKYSAQTRLIVRALLQTPLAKAPGVLPPALRTGA